MSQTLLVLKKPRVSKIHDHKNVSRVRGMSVVSVSSASGRRDEERRRRQRRRKRRGGVRTGQHRRRVEIFLLVRAVGGGGGGRCLGRTNWDWSRRGGPGCPVCCCVAPQTASTWSWRTSWPTRCSWRHGKVRMEMAVWQLPSYRRHSSGVTEGWPGNGGHKRVTARPLGWCSNLLMMHFSTNRILPKTRCYREWIELPAERRYQLRRFKVFWLTPELRWML